jgi:hypothetical protein
LGFNKVISLVLRAEERKDVKHITEAKRILESNQGIPNREWLFDKIDEVEQMYFPQPSTT